MTVVALSCMIAIVALAVFLFVCTRVCEEYEEPAWAGDVAAAHWLRAQMSTLGMVEDALTGIWTDVRETHVWTHMFDQTRGGQLFLEAPGMSRSEMLLNKSNPYSDYLEDYDEKVDAHAERVVSSLAGLARLVELLPSVSARTVNGGTYFRLEPLEELAPTMYAVLSNCVIMKRADDEREVLQKVTLANRRIDDMRTGAAKALDNDRRSAIDAVRLRREEHADLLSGIDAKTRSKVRALNARIYKQRRTLRRLEHKERQLESEVLTVKRMIEQSDTMTVAQRNELRARAASLQIAKQRLATTRKTIADTRADMARHVRNHNNTIRNLGSRTTRARSHQASERRRVSRLTKDVARQNTEQARLTEIEARTDRERRESSKLVQERQRQAAALRAQIAATKASIAALPKLSTDATVKKKAKLESDLYILKADANVLQSLLAKKIDHTVVSQTKHDSLVHRLGDVNSEIKLLEGQGYGTFSNVSRKDLMDVEKENATLRGQLSRMAMDPFSYATQMREIEEEICRK